MLCVKTMRQPATRERRKDRNKPTVDKEQDERDTARQLEHVRTRHFVRLGSVGLDERMERDGDDDRDNGDT